MNLLELSADEILNVNDPRVFFTEDNVIELGRRAYKLWHPDVNKSPIANDVFVHIRKLVDLFGNLRNHKINFQTHEGKEYIFKYMTKFPIDVGELYIASSFIMMLFDDGNEDLADNFRMNLNGLKFSEDRYKKQFAPYLPVVMLNEQTNIGRVIVIKNQNKMVRLIDLVKSQGGKIPPKHVAWILNSLYNFGVFMEKEQKMALNGISVENVFVDVKNHLASPWLAFMYAKKHKEKLIAIPTSVRDLISDKLLGDKTSKTEIDRYLIRMLGLYSLGGIDYLPGRVNKDKEVDSRLVLFTISGILPESKTMLDDYEKWNDLLKEVYGKRKFIELNVSFDDVYQPT